MERRDFQLNELLDDAETLEEEEALLNDRRYVSERWIPRATLRVLNFTSP